MFVALAEADEDEEVDETLAVVLEADSELESALAETDRLLEEPPRVMVVPPVSGMDVDRVEPPRTVVDDAVAVVLDAVSELDGALAETDALLDEPPRVIVVPPVSGIDVDRVEPPITVVEFRLAETVPLTEPLTLTLAELDAVDWLAGLLSAEETDEELIVDVTVAFVELGRLDEIALELSVIGAELVLFEELVYPELADVLKGKTTEELPLGVMLAETELDTLVTDGADVVAFALTEKVLDGNPELTPVGPTTAIVELAEIDTPELAVVVAFAVIGAECVCTAEVPFSTQVVVYVVKLVSLLDTDPRGLEDVTLALIENVLEGLPVPVGPTTAVEFADTENPVLAVEFAVIGAECVCTTAEPLVVHVVVYVVKLVSLLDAVPRGLEVVALALMENVCDGTPVPVGPTTAEVELAEYEKPVPVGPTNAVVELAETENPELAVEFAVIGAECVWITAEPFVVQVVV
ncbi:hypothetical protein LTR85_011849 [Meristemomyces frigidus]|nr:hypothetical protein LTR85_011849 [Meristemomyces frigidus]